MLANTNNNRVDDVADNCIYVIDEDDEDDELLQSMIIYDNKINSISDVKDKIIDNNVNEPRKIRLTIEYNAEDLSDDESVEIEPISNLKIEDKLYIDTTKPKILNIEENIENTKNDKQHIINKFMTNVRGESILTENIKHCESVEKVETEEPINVIINKGTGAGGANTNYFGKKFEEKTSNQIRLINDGYTKHSFTKNQKKAYNYYLSKSFEDKTIVFVLQNGLKMYMKNKYNIELFRCPDEAYIIEYDNGKKVIKILEKKEQNVEGSVETKLWSGPSLKREYELVLGDDFDVHYGFCVSEFLKKKIISNEKKYTILNTIFNENNIAVLFGDDENYFETFDIWFNNSL